MTVSSIRAVVFLVIPSATIGLLLLKRGWWPRRVGLSAHCGACDYNVDGITSERCPECGRALSPTSVIRGERRRRPVTASAGAALLLLALGVGGLIAGRGLAGVDWYRYRSFSSLMRQVNPPYATDAARAWAELRRRADAGALSDSQRTAYVERMLAEQASGAVSSMSGPVLRELVAWASGGQLNAAQRARFIRAATRMALTVPTRCPAGTPIAYRIDGTGRAGAEVAWLQNARLTISLNGVPLDRLAEEQTGWGLGLASFAGSLPPQPVGRYRLRALVEIHVGENETLLFENEAEGPDGQVLEAEVEVVP